MSYIVTRLDQNKQYYFTICATSHAGLSLASEEVTVETTSKPSVEVKTIAYTEPGKMRPPTQTRADYCSIGLGWEDPVNTGGCAITGFTLQYRELFPVNKAEWRVVGTTRRSELLKGLKASPIHHHLLVTYSYPWPQS